MDVPSKKNLKESKFIFDQAIKGLGFEPNSLKMMAHKNNILGSLSLLFANIRGFSSVQTSPLLALKLLFKNFKWAIQAKKQKHQEVPLYLKYLVANLSSAASGCRYCQAHTAFEAHNYGVSIEKIEQMWSFETSDLYSAAEKAALRFGFASGSVPNQVTAEQLLELEQFFTQPQIVELVAVVSMYGFLNRWNDSMSTALESQVLEFARQNLVASGWVVGKHG